MMTDLWPLFSTALAPRFDRDDDPALWSAVVHNVYRDAQALSGPSVGHPPVFTRLGRCSHWMRPHQSRWRADGGFAWPSGYGRGLGVSPDGLPGFDWFGQWSMHPETGEWATSTGDPPSGASVFRVAIPSRSRRHGQAAVHTTWRPGLPSRPRDELVQFYGFRRRSGVWACTAYRAWPDEQAYERAAGVGRGGPSDRGLSPVAG